MAETERVMGPPLGAEFELTVDRLVAGGNGLSFVDGVAVFVTDAAAGDHARVRVARTGRITSCSRFARRSRRARRAR